jgi:hypothetical protein
MLASVHMTRCVIVALLLACAGCATREPAIEAFPETLAGWRRTSLREIPPAESPDPVPKESVRQVFAAAYEGAGKIDARAYLLTRQEIGLDIAQRWRPTADAVFFWARSYFVVVSWQEAERKALQEFTRALEKRLNAQ